MYNDKIRYMASKKLMITNEKQYERFKENVENYEPLIDYIIKNKLSEDTKKSYIAKIATYCCSQDLYIEDLINEAKEEEKLDKPFSDKKLKQRLDAYKEYLNDVGYAYETMKNRVKTVRGFYRIAGITIPHEEYKNAINPKLREDIKSSHLFNDFLEETKITNSHTIGGYLTSLTGYCDYYKMSIEELINEAEKEESENVRLSKRKIKKRLIEYRNYIFDKYSKKTIRTKMSDISYFYVVNDITIPKLPKPPSKYDSEISFDEVPTKSDVKRAIETTTNIRNRAMFLFCMTSGSGSAEVREFTVEEYIRGIKDIPQNITLKDGDIDIYEALDEIDGDKEFVPTFHFVRIKKNRDYFTCITPEANQYIVNWLKTRKNLSLNDKVFDYSRKSLINAFQYVNDKNEWGWVNQNRQRYFTSHQLRRLNANLIEEEKLVNQIQGRKFDETSEAYFKRDKKKIKEHYLRWINELTIYEEYETTYLTDTKYAEFTEKLKEKDDIIDELKANNDEQTKIIKELENKTEEIKTDVDIKIKEKAEDIKKDLLTQLSPNDLKTNTIRKKIREYIYFNKDELKIEESDIPPIIEQATTIALKHEDIYNDGKGIQELISKAKFELNIDKTLKERLNKEIEESDKIVEHMQTIWTYVMEFIDKNELSNVIGGENQGDKLIGYLLDNKEKYARAEINDKLAIEIIKEAMYYDDVVYN